jgi:hypothetical protein
MNGYRITSGTVMITTADGEMIELQCELHKADGERRIQLLESLSCSFTVQQDELQRLALEFALMDVSERAGQHLVGNEPRRKVAQWKRERSPIRYQLSGKR